MKKTISVKNNKLKLEYKLFELNEVAQYGFAYVSGDVLNPVSQKILLCLIWKCNIQTPGVFDSVQVSMTELCEILGYRRKGNSNYSHRLHKVEETLLYLMSKPILVHDAEKKMKISFAWLKKVKIAYETGIVTAYFDNDLFRFFGQSLRSNFTVVKLKYLNRLNTSYSITLYSFFCSKINLGNFSQSIENIIKLVLNKESYEYKHLKSDILKPSIQSINSLTDIRVSFKEYKSGRRVIRLEFHVEKDAADDEKDLFMLYHRLKYDEFSEQPYDEEWMRGYKYSMEEQKYIPSR